MSSTNRFRNFESGSQKRKKKQRIEELTQSQKGAIDRFIIKESQVSSSNQTLDQAPALDRSIENNPRDDQTGTENNAEVQEVLINDTSVEINNNDADNNENTDDSFQPDIFDPRYWDSLNPKQIDILAQKGPRRDLSIQKGPKDRYSRRFSALFYNRVLSNGEHCDRDWLVYCKELDRVFCFSYKLFTKGHRKGQLANEGYNDWIHLGSRLKEHETSADHVLNMTIWYELRSRLENDQAIDKTAQQQLEKEKDHWRKVLFRIHSLAFRGTNNSKLYEDSNGNFLGLIEMLAEFDPVIQEHVRPITSEETLLHYLDPKIQNELIHLLASAIKSEIVSKIKRAKYFSVILDCTPDASHQEQMSLIIRYVYSSSDNISIEESFLGFLDVNDTTGQGLFDVLENEIKCLDLDIDDTCGRAKDFFGIIQRIYTTFANSTKKWQILKDNITGLTLKSVSATRWESRVESVKAIRFQCADIREALL
ncbi:hypothetical protein DAI22_11g203300 [Oryza sativa Japonica Group]|nr:hypothetical protein DAI22_11g203300 [Oryza sativa Japonica Group]